MAAGILDITIEQGATFSRTINYTDSEGEPIDLTGCTIAAQIRQSFSSSTAYAFTMTLTDAAEGEFTWVMSATNTALINATAKAKWVYDVEITYPSGIVERILQGSCDVSQQVTR